MFDSASVAVQQADDDYAELSRRLPSFAGMYISRGELVVAVVGKADSTAVRAAVHQYLRDQGLDDLVLRVRSAKYTYQRLRAEKDRLMGTLKIKELTFAGIDEVANQIRIGVATEEAWSKVCRQLAKFGTPADMVHVEVGSAFQRISR
jgi:hypothetical protein